MDWFQTDTISMERIRASAGRQSRRSSRVNTLLMIRKTGSHEQRHAALDCHDVGVPQTLRQAIHCQISGYHVRTSVHVRGITCRQVTYTRWGVRQVHCHAVGTALQVPCMTIYIDGRYFWHEWCTGAALDCAVRRVGDRYVQCQRACPSLRTGGSLAAVLVCLCQRFKVSEVGLNDLQQLGQRKCKQVVTKEFKGRSHNAEERVSTHSRKSHATSQLSLLSPTHSLTAQPPQPLTTHHVNVPS